MSHTFQGILLFSKGQSPLQTVAIVSYVLTKCLLNKEIYQMKYNSISYRRVFGGK